MYDHAVTFITMESLKAMYFKYSNGIKAAVINKPTRICIQTATLEWHTCTLCPREYDERRMITCGNPLVRATFLKIISLEYNCLFNDHSLSLSRRTGISKTCVNVAAAKWTQNKCTRIPENWSFNEKILPNKNASSETIHHWQSPLSRGMDYAFHNAFNFSGGVQERYLPWRDRWSDLSSEFLEWTGYYARLSTPSTDRRTDGC